MKYYGRFLKHQNLQIFMYWYVFAMRSKQTHVNQSTENQYWSHKKSPANTKGNVQQQCMFKSPVKQNLQSPEGARWPVANYLWCFTRTCQRAWPVSVSQRCVGWKWQIFLTLLSFSALARGDPFQIYAKALLIFKLVFHAANGEDLVILSHTIFD